MAATQETCNKLKLLLLGDRPEDVLYFAQKWPISPKDGSLMGLNPTKKAPNFPGRGQDIEKPLFAKFKLQGIASRIGFATLDPHLEKKGSIRVGVQYADKGSTQNLVPMWWLPWYGGGGLVKLKIEDSGTLDLGQGTDRRNMQNPGVFFTAALSGCSVFVYGDPTKPTVYHAGLTGNVEATVGPQNWRRLGGTSESVWRNLFKGAYYTDIAQSDHKKAILLRDPHGHKSRHPMGEVNKSEYVSERNEDGSYLVEGGEATGRSLALQDWLKDTHANTFCEITVEPWGCVFGLRDNQNWRFYLQRNSTVFYKELHKKRSFFKTKLVPGPQQVTSTVMGVQRFYPDKGQVMWTPLARTQVFKKAS